MEGGNRDGKRVAMGWGNGEEIEGGQWVRGGEDGKGAEVEGKMKEVGMGRVEIFEDRGNEEGEQQLKDGRWVE